MKKFIIPLLAATVLLGGCQHVYVRHAVHVPVPLPVLEHRHSHNSVVFVHKHEGGHHSGHRHQDYRPGRIVVVTPPPVIKRYPSHHVRTVPRWPKHREPRHNDGRHNTGHRDRDVTPSRHGQDSHRPNNPPTPHRRTDNSNHDSDRANNDRSRRRDDRSTSHLPPRHTKPDTRGGREKTKRDSRKERSKDRSAVKVTKSKPEKQEKKKRSDDKDKKDREERLKWR